MRQLNRQAPVLPVQAYKTYGVRSPKETHHRPATCEEVNCKAFTNGWKTVCDESTEIGKQRADQVRALPNPPDGWTFRETKDAETGHTVFLFPAGQRCFQFFNHTVRLDRPEFYIVRGGDWRAVTQPARMHQRPEDWVEDFAEHQDALKTVLDRG